MRVVLLILCFLMFSCGEDEPQIDASVLAETETQDTTEEAVELNTETKMVSVYYRHPIIDGIVPIQRPIFEHPSDIEQIKQLINQLSIAPEDKSGIPIWPEDTRFRELYLLSDGTIIVDFEGSFVSSISAGAETESFLLNALVNTLLDNFPRYERVRILVDGEIRETFLGHLDIEFPLKKDNRIYTVVPETHSEDDIIIEDLGPIAREPEQGLN